MSRITVKDLDIEDYSANIKRFSKKLEELSVIEKELNLEGFQVIISKIKKKG